jgi:hypothetical protein
MNTMKRRPIIDSRARQTVLAANTLESVNAALDSRSILALEWAQHWATVRGSPRPRPAVILRRALAVYAGHLDGQQGPEAANAELIALAQAGKGHGTARDTTAGRARLEAAGRGPIAWLDVAHSLESRKLSQDINAALEARMGASR